MTKVPALSSLTRRDTGTWSGVRRLPVEPRWGPLILSEPEEIKKRVVSVGAGRILTLAL